MSGDLSLGKFHGAGHTGGKVGGMGDGDEGEIFLGVQFHEQLAELVGGGFIKSAGGFIGKQELRFVD